jgi:hypothetical protein
MPVPGDERQKKEMERKECVGHIMHHDVLGLREKKLFLPNVGSVSDISSGEMTSGRPSMLERGDPEPVLPQEKSPAWKDAGRTLRPSFQPGRRLPSGVTFASGARPADLGGSGMKSFALLPPFELWDETEDGASASFSSFNVVNVTTRWELRRSSITRRA